METILNHYRGVLSPLGLNHLLVAFCLLTFGLLSGPPVLARRIGFLTAYPLWVLKRIERLMKRERGFPALFFLILSLNSASLLANVLSGLTVVLPFIFAWLLGLNLSVILARMTGGRVFLPILLNPVAWLEIPAACLSLAGGMRIGLALYVDRNLPEVMNSLLWGADLYLSVILPLLVIAAALESYLINRMRTARTGGEWWEFSGEDRPGSGEV